MIHLSRIVVVNVVKAAIILSLVKGINGEEIVMLTDTFPTFHLY